MNYPFNNPNQDNDLSAPQVFICILNWNGWEDTIECLESVLRSSYSNYRIVVLDNASTDNSYTKIRDWAERKVKVASPFLTDQRDTKEIYVAFYNRDTAEQGGDPQVESKLNSMLGNQYLVFIQTGANLGYAGGNNIGIRYALALQADYVWLLNNDTVIEHDALQAMIVLAEQYPEAGMLGSKLLLYDKPNCLEAIGGAKFLVKSPLGQEDRGQWEQVKEMDYIFGASLLVKRATIMDTGLMDEDYFLYCEEIDWNIVARRKKWQLLYCPKSLVYHKLSKSIDVKAPIRDYYLVRNRLILLKKFNPLWIPFVLLKFVLAASKLAVKGEWDNVRAMVEGFNDFLRGVKGKK